MTRRSSSPFPAPCIALLSLSRPQWRSFPHFDVISSLGPGLVRGVFADVTVSFSLYCRHILGSRWRAGNTSIPTRQLLRRLVLRQSLVRQSGRLAEKNERTTLRSTTPKGWFWLLELQAHKLNQPATSYGRDSRTRSQAKRRGDATWKDEESQIFSQKDARGMHVIMDLGAPGKQCTGICRPGESEPRSGRQPFIRALVRGTPLLGGDRSAPHISRASCEHCRSS